MKQNIARLILVLAASAAAALFIVHPEILLYLGLIVCMALTIVAALGVLGVIGWAWNVVFKKRKI